MKRPSRTVQRKKWMAADRRIARAQALLETAWALMLQVYRDDPPPGVEDALDRAQSATDFMRRWIQGAAA